MEQRRHTINNFELVEWGNFLTVYIITGKEKKREAQRWMIGRTVKFESVVDKYRELKLIWLESGLSNR